MKKINKLFLATGAVVAMAIPVVTAVSCVDLTDDIAINCGSYAGSFQKLANGDISVAGAWGDARFYAGDQAKNIESVGVEATRISNDGIQVRSGMKMGDEIALQKIFAELIIESKTNAALQLKGKSLFSIYSHDGYTALKQGSEVNAMIGGKPRAVSTNSDVTSDTFDEAQSEYFITAGSNEGFNGFKSKKTLKIVFIPSNDPSLVHEATKLLEDFLKSKNVNTEIAVSTNYDLAATQLANDQIDVAFLPVETWHEHAGNTKFIIQAARPTQIATMTISNEAALPGASLASELKAVELFNKYGQLYLKDINDSKVTSEAKTNFLNAAQTAGSDEAKIKAFADSHATDANAMMAGAYESWIYARKGSPFDLYIKANGKQDGWKLNWSAVSEDVIYGYTSSTSASAYVYPEIWFQNHFDGFKSFQG